MAEKKCRYCATAIPVESKICPYCRRSVGSSKISKYLLGFVVMIALLATIGYISSRNYPSKNEVSSSGISALPMQGTFVSPYAGISPFQIIQYDPRTYGLIFTSKAVDKDFIKITYRIRQARRDGSISKLFPEWKNNGEDTSLEVFVFTDSQWATGSNVSKFIRTSLKESSQLSFSHTFTKHIRAHYLNTALEEEGSIGYDDAINKSKHYKQLFYTSK